MKTATPYHVYQTNWTVGKQIQPRPNSFNVGTTINGKDIVVCQCSDLWLTPEQNRENAEWIAKCCNSQEALVNALERFERALGATKWDAESFGSQVLVYEARESALEALEKVRGK